MRAWWRRQTVRRRDDLHCILYSRPGCHLCEVAWDDVVALQKEYGFGLEKIDVDGDPALKAEFGEWVPVLKVNGKVRFRGGVNVVLFKRMLLP